MDEGGCGFVWRETPTLPRENLFDVLGFSVWATCSSFPPPPSARERCLGGEREGAGGVGGLFEGEWGWL